MIFAFTIDDETTLHGLNKNVATSVAFGRICVMKWE